MRGATDIRLNVTMDSTQARAESERLHKELARRYRIPDSKDVLHLTWDRATGMPVNPMNPNLPYEEARHSGIWWANQRGVRGLGNQEYRHQFFTEREARYMGLQFARAANKEFKVGAQGIATTLGAYLLNEIGSTHYARAIKLGQNNRELKRNEATFSGGMSGAGIGAGLIGSVLALAGLAGAPLTFGTSLALTAAGAGIAGVGGAAFARSRAKAGERNEDLSNQNQFYTQEVSYREGRRLQFSDMALQRQMEMMPSRVGKLQLIGAQLEQITNGAGKMSIRNLEGLRDAMLNGGEWGGRKFNKGDLETTEGQQVLAFLQTQYGRRESLLSQRQQLQFTPFARPQESITDDYSRRGLFVGAQVNVPDTNRIITADMRRLIKLLDETRKNTADNSGVW